MNWLNYHHLLYFWLAAREGSISRASERLLVSQPAVSTQIRRLETALGEKLFSRVGRHLVLTEAGRTVYRYAEEIFSLGQEIPAALRGEAPRRVNRLVVGVTDVLSKRIAYRLLEPALALDEALQIVCREGKAEDLLGELAVQRLDLVLSDTPLTPTLRVRAFNHLLGSCSLTICGVPRLVSSRRRRFPQSLQGAPFLLPTENTAVRQALDEWFLAHDLRPDVKGEFEDSALLEAFGEAGLGLFAVPTVLEREVQRQYRVRRLGRLESVRMPFYAISTERKLQHPAVRAISAAARGELFA